MSESKMNTFCTLFVLRNTKKDKTASIYLRLTSKGERVEISLQRTIPEGDWDKHKGKAKGISKEARELNYYLETVIATINDYRRQLEKDHLPVSPQTIRRMYLGQDGRNKKLVEEYEDHNKKCRELIGNGYVKSTCDKFDTSLNHLKAFLKAKYKRTDIYFSEINHEFIKDFDHYLRADLKMQNNTVVKHLKNLKKLILMAIKKDWIRKDPFIYTPFKWKETNIDFLTKEELHIIKGKEIKNERLEKVRDIFIFCCYTGLAFIDAYTLNPTHLTKDTEGRIWILKKRVKTGVKSNIPLIDEAIKILEKYKEHPVCIERGTLLPVISNTKMNTYLKELADICGIEKNLSTHVARHTCATTVLLGHKVSLINTSHVLGHSSTRMTEKYTHIVNDQIAEDVFSLNGVI